MTGIDRLRVAVQAACGFIRQRLTGQSLRAEAYRVKFHRIAAGCRRGAVVLGVVYLGLASPAPASGPAPSINQANPTNESAAPMRPARDGNIAIQEEFDHAASINTEEAWLLFIARHPDHPLTAAARTRLAAARSQTPPDPLSTDE